MTTVYVDTSALGALLIDQPESDALLQWLDETTATLVSSDLLETELRRLAVREALDQSDVIRLLDGVNIVALERSIFRSAGLLPMPHLRTLDALHLATAIGLSADAILSYDQRLCQAALAVGIDVVAPGRVTEISGHSGPH